MKNSGLWSLPLIFFHSFFSSLLHSLCVHELFTSMSTKVWCQFDNNYFAKNTFHWFQYLIVATGLYGTSLEENFDNFIILFECQCTVNLHYWNRWTMPTGCGLFKERFWSARQWINFASYCGDHDLHPFFQHKTWRYS